MTDILAGIRRYKGIVAERKRIEAQRAAGLPLTREAQEKHWVSGYCLGAYEQVAKNVEAQLLANPKKLPASFNAIIKVPAVRRFFAAAVARALVAEGYDDRINKKLARMQKDKQALDAAEAKAKRAVLEKLDALHLKEALGVAAVLQRPVSVGRPLKLRVK